jgi:type VII secretion-associated serine protease mycosin
MRRSHRVRRSLAVFSVLAMTGILTLLGLTAGPAHAACTKGNLEGKTRSSEQPWPQKLWDLSRLPQNVDGSGVVVAVLDSGVDFKHPQLRDQTLTGTDELRKGDGREDCVGHGTGVASIIAAKSISGVEFRGIAPGARILSVRVSENIEGQTGQVADQADPAEMAHAINFAVAHGAKVINMSLSYTNVDPAKLRPFSDAIAAAIAKDVVVIAAAGNSKDKGNPTPYPAAWDNVLGVGAIDSTGQRLEQSQTGDYVDLVAPGAGVTTAWPGGGHAVGVSGTSFAAPMVAGAAALVREAYPDLTEAQVRRRLLATADPAPGGRRSAGYGIGVVNPLRAVTEVIDGVGPAKPASLAPPSIDPVAVAAQEHNAELRTQAWWLAGIGVIVAGLVIALTTAMPNGIRRRWRAASR